MDELDAAAELANIRDHKKVIRKRVYRKSKLDKYEDKLLALHRQGATIADLQLWLEDKKNINVAWSTVQYWLAKNG